MKMFGKMLGTLFGTPLGPVGMLAGAAMGHAFDTGILRVHISTGRRCFTETLFALMGHVARADGRVSEAEIAFADQIMDQLELSGSERERAISGFNAGRADQFDPGPSISNFRAQFGIRSTACEQLFAALIAQAYADRKLDENKLRVLKSLSVGLGFRQDEFERELLRFGPTPPANIDVPKAYSTLGLTQSASADEVVHAYRKLISQYHPDKLEGRGIRGDALRGAQAKARDVRQAYECLCAVRSLK